MPPSLGLRRLSWHSIGVGIWGRFLLRVRVRSLLGILVHLRPKRRGTGSRRNGYWIDGIGTWIRECGITGRSSLWLNRGGAVVSVGGFRRRPGSHGRFLLGERYVDLLRHFLVDGLQDGDEAIQIANGTTELLIVSGVGSKLEQVILNLQNGLILKCGEERRLKAM